MNKKSILLIEDNPDDVTLTKRAFNKHFMNKQYHLYVAKNGKQAIDVLTRGVRPHVIILDLHMPKLDGFDVIRFIRSYQPTKTIPIIILSSSSDENEIRKTYELGANSYIKKSYDFTDFVSSLKSIYSYWMTVNISGNMN